MMLGRSILVVVALLHSASAYAGTVKRSCEGAPLIRYEIAGKGYSYTGKTTTTAVGVSKGAAPSPVLARRRACRDAARQAADKLSETAAVTQICGQHKDARGSIVFLGGIGRSKGEEQTASKSGASKSFECRGGKPYRTPICGDGNVGGAEECDDGPKNSDTQSDACRTDCTKANCGDGVTDRGEQCDEGPGNHDQIPGACRTTCERAHCGDGVVDPAADERCDDGNTDPYDGCHACQQCVTPRPGLAISSDTVLCAGTHRLDDPNAKGSIVVRANGVTLDCRGAQLVGSQQRGVGIVVAADDVVVRGCEVRAFATGIAVRAPRAIVFDSRACGNKTDLEGLDDTVGARNQCSTAGPKWTEAGKAGCSSRCQ